MGRDLKPCPFCGGKGEIKLGIRPDLSAGSSPDMWSHPGDRWTAEVRCCGCVIAYRSPEFPTYQEATNNAIAAWNRRVGDE